jgi:hypothetical protein
MLIHLRFASVRTYTFFTTGFPRFLSIRRARGLQAFDLPLLTNYMIRLENDYTALDRTIKRLDMKKTLAHGSTILEHATA